MCRHASELGKKHQWRLHLFLILSWFCPSLTFARLKRVSSTHGWLYFNYYSIDFDFVLMHLYFTKNKDFLVCRDSPPTHIVTYYISLKLNRAETWYILIVLERNESEFPEFAVSCCYQVARNPNSQVKKKKEKKRVWSDS